MILKKKEIIAASLVVLIGLAGYLNWSYQDTVRVKDNESYVETGKILGEAEMVSSSNEMEDDAEPAAEDAAAQPESAAYFAEAKQKREEARAAAMEALKAVSEDDKADEETRASAGQRLAECAEYIRLESSIENVAAAKGYEDICVYINEGTAVVTVKTEGLTDTDAAIISDIVTSTACIEPSGIRLIEVKN
ncbi:MAG: SpoIIIAH-like family protein [Clostridia bacterium]|nr:SpoIIIAH-like family protein [Clostridia bacterium]